MIKEALLALVVLLAGACSGQGGGDRAGDPASPTEEQRSHRQGDNQATPAGEGAFSFTAAGDHGATAETSATLELLKRLGVDFHLALGDLSYSDIEPESKWCDYIHSFLGEAFPFQLLVGNHEDDDRMDGHIDRFKECLPDRLRVTGEYAKQYYFDFPKAEPIARFIMIAADNDLDGTDYQFCNKKDEGNQRCAWLNSLIADARGRRMWVIVGMHKPLCITIGNKNCEVGEPLMDSLIDARVDLVLTGHDHDYQRSKQLKCADASRYTETCVADDGADGVYVGGEGTVTVINGVFGGGGVTDINLDDPERGYFAAWMGHNDDKDNRPPGADGHGVSRYVVTKQAIHAEFVGSTTNYRDSFVIERR